MSNKRILNNTFWQNEIKKCIWIWNDVSVYRTVFRWHYDGWGHFDAHFDKKNMKIEYDITLVGGAIVI